MRRNIGQKSFFMFYPSLLAAKTPLRTPGVMWLLEGAKLKHGCSRSRDAAPCSHIKSMKIVHQMRHHPIIAQVLLSLHWHIIVKKKNCEAWLLNALFLVNIGRNDSRLSSYIHWWHGSTMRGSGSHGIVSSAMLSTGPRTTATRNPRTSNTTPKERNERS